MSMCARSLFLTVWGLSLLWTSGVDSAPPSPAEQDYQKGEQFHLGRDVEPDLDMALRYYGRALKAAPEMFPALYNAAHIYYTQEEYGRAARYFTKAVKAARKDKTPEREALARSNLGSCFQKQGEVEKAEKQFRAAVQLDRSLVDAHVNLVNLLVSEEKWDEAEKALEAGRRLAPSARYGLFEGKIKGGASRDEWEPLELKVVIVGLVVGALCYGLYQRFRPRQRRV